MKEVPKFASKAELVRYITENDRHKGNRPAVAAFLPNLPDEKYLSVNSLEVQKLKEIADYHRWNWQDNDGKVAMCVHKVRDYSEAAQKSGLSVSYDKTSSQWQFADSSQTPTAAYRHRPVSANSKNPLGSYSHSGVEFAQMMDEHLAGRFARQLVKKRFHLV